MNEIEEETFLQNKDICKMRGCSSSTATEIMRKIKRVYEIDEELLPHKKCIPLSLYQDLYRKRSKSEWRRKRPKEKDA